MNLIKKNCIISIPNLTQCVLNHGLPNKNKILYLKLLEIKKILVGDFNLNMPYLNMSLIFE